MKIYQVGGSVRDEIMGIKPHDFDYVVVGTTEKEFLEKYPDAKKVGKNFPVFLVDGNEYAFARSEKKVAPGYRGFEIDSSSDITLEEDLLRRDITINAIAKNIETGDYIDPFNGIKDIANKKIVHVSDKFSEDPLRVYRVARFAAQFPDFTVDKKTIILMAKLKTELKTLSSERVFTELMKTLEKEKPFRFFETLEKANSLEEHFIEFKNKNKLQEHFENFSKYADEKLFISFGLILTDKEIETFYKRLKAPNKLYLNMLNLYSIKEMLNHFDKKNAKFIYKFIEISKQISLLTKEEFIDFIKLYKFEDIKFIEKITELIPLLDSLRIPEAMRNKGKDSSGHLIAMKVDKIREYLSIKS